MMEANISHNPVAMAHQSFVTNPKGLSCLFIHNLHPKEQCAFVKITKECTEDVQFINYLEVLFCDIDRENEFQTYSFIFAMILWCCYLFLILGVIADKFFCPALAYLSHKMHLSENLAGATILAFGNGSPDIFTAIVNYEHDTEMLFAGVYGGALFVIGVVSALIIIVRPFKVTASVLVRDIVFLLASCLWIYISVEDEHISNLEANGAIGIYLVYIIVLISEHFLTKQESTEDIQRGGDNLDSVNTGSESGSVKYNPDPEPTKNMCEKFLQDINPIEVEAWTGGNVFKKIICIIKIPITFILLITIPIVDESVENSGWSRLLNSLHVVTLPLTIIIFQQWYSSWIIVVPVMSVAMILSVAVFLTSQDNQAPIYHLAFSIFGPFVGSLYVISTVAAEVVSVLKSFGIVCNISQAILGMSVLSWGNSISDLISSIALARSGHAKMGFTACFAGPLYNTLITIGTVFNLKLYFARKSEVVSRTGAMEPVCAIFLALLLSLTLGAFYLTRFQGRRIIGVFMLFIYSLFFLFCMLGEFEIIHPYGTDHQNEGEE